jgi:hypothetical protein
MARKENMTDLNLELGVFTLNETSVGRAGNNRKRSDVQLVQFFLQQFYFEHREMFDGRVPRTKNGVPEIKIDGICGRQTELGILNFQKYHSGDGVPIIVDGLVNISRTFSSEITGMPYTIGFLNNWFRRFGNGNQFHGNLENHPVIIQFAPELQAELAAAQVGDEMINI